MRALTLTDASVIYSGRTKVHAVQGVSLSIPEGCTVALVGESGSGKSSTARVVAGLQQLTAGSIGWTGEPDGTFTAPVAVGDIGDRPRVQMVFQHPDQSLDPMWSVRRSVAEPLRRLGVKDRDATETAVVTVLEKVGLDGDFLDRRPRELSGGQAQRVAVARALVASPNVVVLDEPTASLDQTVRSRLIATLAGLQDEFGTGYLMVTHDMSSVQRLADTVLVMYRGRLLETGPTEVILSAPAHPYTRALIDAVPPIDPRVRWDPAAVARDMAGVSGATACPVPGACTDHGIGLVEIAPGHRVRCTTTTQA
ncbi:ATP-binding cassette domain-containing protein [Nakamurella sp. YIM 132087]|uniref:ATP-binding cassette domain-containing protein n=1 Tax=Nakamurella alba TaxID=2665158 RepID=A0A7K1FRN9_9ACTN|nr:ABC transporter ATP-binding protein [Nakamurella alba]MTD15474.1 ATP-binding cassette domain-containing protein [Nakamurella alba]